MNWVNEKVKMVKISATKTPDYETPDWDEYKSGESNFSFSVPVDYTVKGMIWTEPTIGKSLNIARTERNGIPALGRMTTSVGKKIEKLGKTVLKIETLNSLYIITKE